jgi:hypothetical protein
MEAPESDGVRPWADLPVEMVDTMAHHLDLFSTNRLAAVCTSWSKAVATNAALPFGTPCLLMTSEQNDEDYYGALGDDHEDWTYQLKDLTTKENGVSFPALIRREQWWIGGKDDWLAVVDECGGARLLNPYTGRLIDLPRIAAPVDPSVVIKNERWRAFDRIVVCATPSDDEGYLVIGMADDEHLLAIARRGDESWTALRNSGGYTDAVVHKGKVFAVHKSGSIHAWDIQGGGACTDPEVLQPPDIGRGESWKLAESADGRRLLVVCTYGKCRRSLGKGRCFEYCLGFEAQGVHVYERDVDGDGDDGWSPVTSLGDNSLFLGANYPFFARVVSQVMSDSECSMVRPNCICFAKGQLFQSEECDLEVFDLGAGVYQYNQHKLLWSNSRYNSSYQEPIWFRPKLKNYDLE